MLTTEDEQRLINKAVEAALLELPKVVGNLIVNKTQMLKLNREFYQAHPDFANHKDIVAAVVERLDSEHPGVNYKKILDQAAGEIKNQIGQVSKLDTKPVSKPSRNLGSIRTDHGEI